MEDPKDKKVPTSQETIKPERDPKEEGALRENDLDNVSGGAFDAYITFDKH